MLPSTHREPTLHSNRRAGPLVSLAVIGSLTVGGWLAGRWLSPRPAEAPPSLAARPSPLAPRPSSLAPRSKATPPANDEIAAMRDKAIGVLGEVEEVFSNDAAVMSSLAAVYGLWGLDDEASDRWQRSMLLDPRSGRPYSAMGNAALARGDYEEAVRMLRKALELDPSQDRARLRLGEALTSAGRTQEAVTELTKYLANYPRSTGGLFRLGQAYFHLRQYEKARQSYERAVELDPQFDFAYHALASTCEALGRHEEAEKHRQQFTRLAGGKPAPGMRQRDPVTDLELGRANLAETHLVAARAYLGPASTSRKLDRTAEAQRHLRAAARADPKNRESRITLLKLLDREKRFREAAELLAELEELEPKDPVHRINRGVLLVRIQEYVAAEKEFREAIALAPEEADGYAKLAGMYALNKSKVAEARKLAQSAIRLRPNDALNHVLLAEICEQEGDRPAALAAIARAVELEPANPRLQQAKARLNAKRQEQGPPDETSAGQR